MKLDFKDIIDKHKNVPCIVTAHGPSLNAYADKIKEYQDKGFINIQCNDWYLFQKTLPNYCIIANSVFTIKKQQHQINTNRVPIFYADSVDGTDRTWIEDNINCDYLPYDQRHFGGKRCGCPTCHNAIPGRLTIQEELRKYTGYEKLYNSGDTVAVHMIAFAILMGCNPIYIVGIDLNYGKGFAKNTGKKRIIAESVLGEFRERILSDMDVMRESCNRLGRQIINLNKESTFYNIPIGDI